MKKLLLLLLLFLPVCTYALHIEGEEHWKVTFTENKKMESNFDTDKFSEYFREMQPGDDLTIKIRIRNDNPNTTHWYMRNNIIKSLEDSTKVTKDGAYTYQLTYDNGKEQTIFDSEKVGGDNSSGLHEVEPPLKDYFFLDTLKPGDSGLVKLTILLDGETQGNDYQDTLAQLSIDFATQLPSSAKETETTFISLNPKTGDYSRFLPYLILMALSGTGMLFLSGRIRNKER